VVVFYPIIGPTGLVWGVAIGALMHLAIQLPVLAERGFFPGFTKKINWKMIRQVVGVSLPRTLTLATAQLDDLVLLSMASLFATGSIAIFSFSYNLQAVPLAIVGVSYSVAAFPALAKLYANGQKAEFLSQISDTVRHIAFWSFLSSVLFIVLRAQVVRVILGTGRFNWADTRLTAACLALFAISVIGQSLCLLFVRGYYAAGKTYKPLFINIICTALVIVLAFVFSHWYRAWPGFRDLLENILRVRDLPDTQILVLPLAFSIGFIVNAWLHWVGFEREFGKLPGGVGKSFLQTLGAAVAGGIASYEVLNILATLPTRTVAGIFLQGFVAGLIGIAIFVAILVLLKNNEVKEVGHALGSRFWKRKPVVVEQPEL
jgi:putative peptidoglycan lipid II flippase